MNSIIKNTILLIFISSLFLISGIILLFLLFWLLICVGSYTETNSSFDEFQEIHEKIIVNQQAKAKKPKILLSYRYKKLVNHDKLMYCYINFYQLPNQFDADKFLQQYQPIPKNQFIINNKEKPIDEEINLTNCLNLTQNYDWLQVVHGDKNKFWLLNYNYHRHFLVYGSTKNVHLMDLNVSSPNVESFSKIDNDSNGILLDRKNNVVKIVSTCYGVTWC